MIYAIVATKLRICIFGYVYSTDTADISDHYFYDGKKAPWLYHKKIPYADEARAVIENDNIKLKLKVDTLELDVEPTGTKYYYRAIAYYDENGYYYDEDVYNHEIELNDKSKVTNRSYVLGKIKSFSSKSLKIEVYTGSATKADTAIVVTGNTNSYRQNGGSGYNAGVVFSDNEKSLSEDNVSSAYQAKVFSFTYSELANNAINYDKKFEQYGFIFRSPRMSSILGDAFSTEPYSVTLSLDKFPSADKLYYRATVVIGTKIYCGEIKSLSLK